VNVTDPYEFEERFNRLARSIKSLNDAFAKQAPGLSGSKSRATELDRTGGIATAEPRQEPPHDR
jgi:hypothetical protein